MSSETHNISDAPSGVQSPRLFIVLAGDPQTGFTAFGPYDSEAYAQDICDTALREYGGQDWFVFPLAQLPPPFPQRSAEQWRQADECYVRFATTGIEHPWGFDGPYVSDEYAAREKMLLQPLLLPEIEQLIISSLERAAGV
jgi:hypothetical protein